MKIITQFYRCLALTIGSISFALTAHSQDQVSRTPPPIYQEKLAAFLTPLEKVLKMPNTYADDESGIILINETIHYLTEDGKRYLLRHYAYRANTDAGTEAMTEDIFGYRKGSQKIYLIEAHTIQLNGDKNKVRSNAAILQTPQSQAEDAIYNDAGELLIIFPSVKPGCITEMTILIEEFAPRIPGEYMTGFSWSTVWPRIQKRVVIDVPTPLAERLKFIPIGAPCPKPIKQTAEKGRTRFLMTANNTAREPYEENRAPVSQLGPYTRITSWKSWDDMGDWYSKILEDTKPLSTPLRNKVDAWTSDATSTRNTINILHSKVANEIRYTGLEFGISGYKPYHCNEVWERGYGDCKDKANLLHKMLEHKGITSYLAFLNTDHTGRIERKSPDSRQFTHVILAVKDPDAPGEWLFCDPTISHAPAGLISPNDASREVLILGDKKPLWVTTPPQDAGTINYAFDFKRESNGEISGWFTLEAKDYYAASFAASFAKKDSVARRHYLQDVVSDFYPNIEIIDTEKHVVSKTGKKFKIRAYCIIPALSQSDAQDPVIAFPNVAPALLYLGDSRDRSTPYSLWRDKITMTLKVSLPEGWLPRKLPKPYSVNSDAFSAEGQWSIKNNICSARLQFLCRESTIAPRSFASAFNAVRSVRIWSEQSIPLGNEVSTASTSPDQNKNDSAPNASLDLPIMPSANGQLNLINSRYPTGGNLNHRRAALNKLIQFFPADKKSRFKALVQIAYVDFLEDKDALAAKNIATHLRALGSFTTAQDRGYAQYIRALCLSNIDQKDAAVTIFRKLSEDEQISAFRRAWSAYQAADLMKTKNPDEALKLVTEFRLIDSDSAPAHHMLLAHLLYKNQQLETLTDHLNLLNEEKHPALIEISLALIEEVEVAFSDGRRKYARQLVQVLQNADLRDLDTRDTDLASSLDQLDRLLELGTVSMEIQNQIRQLLERSPPDYLNETPVDLELKSLDDWKAGIKSMKDKDQYDRLLRHCLELIVSFEPDQDFPYYLWRASVYIQWKELDSITPNLKVGIFEPFITACGLIPDTDDHYYECQFIRASYYHNRNKFKQEAEVYRSMLAKANFPDSFSISAHSRFGKALEETGHAREALAQYKKVEKKASEFSSSVSALIRALYINLELGNEKEALRLLDLLDAVEKNVREKALASHQLSQLLLLKKSPGNLKKFWSAQAAWQKPWADILNKLDPGNASKDSSLLIPVLEEEDFSGGLFALAQAKKKSAFLRDYRTLGQAAKWDAHSVNELARVTLFGTISLFPELSQDLRSFVIALYQNYAPVNDDNEKMAFLFLTLAMIDNQQSKEALSEIMNYRKQFPDISDSVSQSMLRLWALALRQNQNNLQPARLALESLLDSDVFIHDRPRTITSLADIYRNKGEIGLEEKLLLKELDHPEIKSNAQSLASLKNRYESLASTGQASTNFSKAVSEWVEQQNLPWFDFSFPRSLKAYSRKTLEQLVQNPDTRFNLVESIKFRLLVAKDPEIPIDVKWPAFYEAVDDYAALHNDYQEFHEIYRSILESSSFTDDHKLEILWVDLRTAAYLDHKDIVAKHLENPLLENANDMTKASFPAFKVLLECDFSNAESLEQAYDDLSREEFTSVHLMIVRRIFNSLLSLGEEDRAVHLQKDASNWQLSAAIGATSTTIRISLLKDLKQFRNNIALNQALSKLVKSRVPDASKSARPEIMDQFFLVELPNYISSEDIKSIYYYYIATGQAFNWNAYQWLEFCDQLDNGEKTSVNLKFAIFHLCLEKTEDDYLRSNIILSSIGAFDLDDKGIRARLAKEYAPYLNLPSAPLTSEMIRLVTAIIKTRTGNDVDFAALATNSKLPIAPEIVLELKLKRYAITKKQSLLKQAVESAKPTQLENESTLLLTLNALDTLGMNDELEIYQETAVKERNRAIADSWATYDPSSAKSALDLTATLNDPDALPEDWLKNVLTANHNEYYDFYIQVQHSSLHSNWEDVKKVSTHAVQKLPTYYWFHWKLGLAHYQLGQPLKAKPYLETYARYGKDSLDYPKALDLLKKISVIEKQALEKQK